MVESEQDTRDGPSGVVTITSGAIVFLLLYILSSGPVTWLVIKFGWPPWSIVAIYFPLIVVGKILPPFGAALDWYVGLWVK